MAAQGVDNFDFKLVGDEEAPFLGYNSCVDKTKLSPQYLIRGSKNVYKKRSGTIANRPGLKVRGGNDTTEAGVDSSWEWNDSIGRTIPLRVSNGKLQFESDIVEDGEYVWYDLLATSTLLNPAASFSRWSFGSWWDNDEQKDRLLGVRGDTNVVHWSGGFTVVDQPVHFINEIASVGIASGGSNYAVGDVIGVTGGGGTGGRFLVATLSGSAVATLTFISAGQNYSNPTLTSLSTSTITGSGSGLTVNITVQNAWGIKKLDTSTTWAEDGFSVNLSAEKKLIIEGVEYTYILDFDTDTIRSVSPTPSFSSGSVAVQSVFIQSLVDEIPDDDFKADFMAVLGNQAIYGSYTSRVIHISTDVNSGSTLGFSNLKQDPTTDLVTGEADYVVLDNVANGLIVREGSVYASAGSSDWYELTPNFVPPISVPFYHDITTSGKAAYVITKVVKKPGTGQSGLLAHEFVDVIANTIYYLSKDNQVRTIGDFNQVEGTQFPIVSQSVYEELKEENFTGGHLKVIGDIVYITAPVGGRHWMYQVRSDVDTQGGVTAERTWHPPQISGISRFANIDGVEYGHSNSNPMIFQVWDTGQWYDDSASGTQLPYNCVARFAYFNHGRRQGLTSFNKVFYEGYLEYGTPLYGNIYYEYQGTKNIKSIEINTDDTPAELFAGSAFASIGGSPLGDDPLGNGPIAESNDQELLPEFRAIRGSKSLPVSKYCLEVLSSEVGARWEMKCLGTNAEKSNFNPTDLQN